MIERITNRRLRAATTKARAFIMLMESQSPKAIQNDADEYIRFADNLISLQEACSDLEKIAQDAAASIQLRGGENENI